MLTILFNSARSTAGSPSTYTPVFREKMAAPFDHESDFMEIMDILFKFITWRH